MENTEKIQAWSETSTLPPLEIAGFFPRILSALLDYFFIAAFASLSRKVLLPADSAFLFDLVIGALYFSLCHSSYLEGQSLGKRLFGLQVIARHPNTNKKHNLLSIPQAFFRYLLAFGIIIILRDVPGLVFRDLQIIAPPYLLESHMLFLLAYFFSNVLSFVTSPTRRAFHDRLSNSIVIRKNTSDVSGGSYNELLLSLPNGASSRVQPLLWGTCLASLLWFIGIQSSSEVSSLQASRYALEASTPFRFMTVNYHNNKVVISGEILNEYFEQSPDGTSQAFAESFTKRLIKSNLVDPSQTESIEFSLYYINTEGTPQQEHVSVPFKNKNE